MRRSLVFVGLAAAALVVTTIPAQAAAPAMSSSDLKKCGFTVQPNLDFWYAGTGTLTPTGKIPAGHNTIIQGKAAEGVKNGTKLELLRFNPSGQRCEGSFDRIGGGITTTVKNGQYYLNFQLTRQGTFGYALQGVSGGATYEIEFQITTS